MMSLIGRMRRIAYDSASDRAEFLREMAEHYKECNPRRDWVDPGHDLPPFGTYRDLDAWVNSDGLVHVGNQAIQVLPVTEVERLRQAIRQALRWLSEDEREDAVAVLADALPEETR